MKELEITIQVRNNRLKRLRMQLGLNQKQFTETVGIGYSAYNGLECLRDSPFTPTGRWRTIAKRLAEFHCIGLETLFPKALDQVVRNKMVRTSNVRDLTMYALDEETRRALPSPDHHMKQQDQQKAIRLVLASLTPRMELVLRMRFGFYDDKKWTLDEVAEHFNFTRERVRQIETKALSRLRNIRVTKRLTQCL